MLDPFAGSGTTLIEAVNHQRQALGLEVNEKYVKISLERIKKECYSSQEEKFYFNEQNLIRWIDSNGNIVNVSLYPAKAREITEQLNKDVFNK